MRSFAKIQLVLSVCMIACTGGALPDAARQTESGEAADTLGQEGEAAADVALGAVDAGLVSCDPRGAACNRAPPSCAEFEAPSVVGGCYGACVRIDRCACDGAADCPDEGRFTCHMYAKHCGPYVH